LKSYVELIVSGKKTIEIRTRNIKFRGEFLIHASQTVDKKTCERNKIVPESLITDAMAGKSNLYDVKTHDSKNFFVRDRNKHFAGSDYTNKKYGFLLTVKEI
jgi:hypothetical protein